MVLPETPGKRSHMRHSGQATPHKCMRRLWLRHRLVEWVADEY
jgi:hypothetical protein